MCNGLKGKGNYPISSSLKHNTWVNSLKVYTIHQVCSICKEQLLRHIIIECKMGTLVNKKKYTSEKKYGHWIAKTKCTLKEIATISFISVTKIWKCIPKDDQRLIKGLKKHE
jgi:hypothetical protein